MELTLDLFEQLEDLYQIKSRHLKYLNSLLPDSWQTTIPRGYGDIWEQRDWKFYLKDHKPYPKPMKLLLPDRKQLLFWTLIGFANELVTQVNPEALANFLDRHVDNPSARRNLEELFLGQDRSGLGFKAFGSMIVCAQEENRMIDRYLPMLRIFAEHDPRHFGVDEELRSLSIGFFREIDDFIRYLDSDIFLFKRFNRDMKELFRGDVSVGVLGVGVASSVLELSRDSKDTADMQSNFAYKKMPPFPDMDSVAYYRELFERYHGILSDIGLNPPAHGIRYVSREEESSTVFITQRKLAPGSIGTQVIQKITDKERLNFFKLILREIQKVDEYNKSGSDTQIGIDPRVSNWGVEGFDSNNPTILGSESLSYLDISTPMIKESGKDLLDPNLMLMGLPGFSKPLIRAFLLKRYWKRFYSLREMVLDLIADIVLHGYADENEKMLEQANSFLNECEPDLELKKITPKGVTRRIRGNSFFRRTFNMFKRIDRFFRIKVLRKKYSYRIPGESDDTLAG